MKQNWRRSVFFVALLLLSGALGFGFSYYRNSQTHFVNAVQTIQTFHYPSLFVAQLAGDPQAGEKIFKQFCSTCHSNPPQIDIQAPAIGDHQAWEARKKMGLAMLLKITLSGVGAMPARGGCFECSDAQLQETIRYILKNS